MYRSMCAAIVSLAVMVLVGRGLAAAVAARPAAGAASARLRTPARAAASPCPAGALLCEDFEDNDFAARGWYDGPRGVVTAAEHAPGSGHAFECTYARGATGCEGDFNSFRFTERRSVAACNGIQGDLDKRDCFPTGGDRWYSGIPPESGTLRRGPRSTAATGTAWRCASGSTASPAAKARWTGPFATGWTGAWSPATTMSSTAPRSTPTSSSTSC